MSVIVVILLTIQIGILKMLITINSFARQFRSYLPELRKSGDAFAHNMTVLCKETIESRLNGGQNDV